MNGDEAMETELATNADLQAVQATLIKWIVGTGIGLFVAMQVFGRVP